MKKCRTCKVWVNVFLSGWEYRRESKGTKWRTRQGTQIRSQRRTQRKKELKSENKNLNSENFSCNLNWRFIVKPKSPSPQSPDGQSEGIMTNQRVWFPIRGPDDQSEGMIANQRACKNGVRLLTQPFPKCTDWRLWVGHSPVVIM